MASTQQDEPKKGNNPTGKGGFGDNPDNRNPGGWNKQTSYSYQLNLMDRMTVKEFKSWLTDHPEDQRTMAQEKAYNAQLKSRKELNWLKEVTDRTEGRARQAVDVTSDGEKLSGQIMGYVIPGMTDNGRSNAD